MTWLLSLKVFFISTGVLFTALGLKVSVPLFLQFGATHVPAMWNFCLLCLKPPYLYVLINGIIIYIAASSRFHHSAAAAVDDQKEESVPPSKAPVVPAYEMKSPPDVRQDLTISEPPVVYEPREEPPVLDVRAVVVNGSVTIEDEDEKEIDDGMDSMESTWTSLESMDSSEIPWDYLSPTEKPLVSARFGHRKPPKASPDGTDLFFSVYLFMIIRCILEVIFNRY